MVIRIFSDRRFLPPGFACHMLLPFWEHVKQVNNHDMNKLDRYILKGRPARCHIEECEYVF